MKLVFVIIFFFALLGFVLGFVGLLASQAQCGPILLSSAIYLGLFSIAYMIEDNGRKN